MKVAIKYCSYKTVSAEGEVENITLYRENKNYYYESLDMIYCYNGVELNARLYRDVDGRSKKSFPCTKCNLRCKAKVIKTNSRPLFLFKESFE